VCNMLTSGQSSWLQIRGSGFDSRRYQIFWEVVCLERSPLGLVSAVGGGGGWRIRSGGPGVRPWGSVALATWRPLSAGVATGFADGLRSLGRCG
jgi:hypothetical protein